MNAMTYCTVAAVWAVCLTIFMLAGGDQLFPSQALAMNLDTRGVRTAVAAVPAQNKFSGSGVAGRTSAPSALSSGRDPFARPGNWTLSVIPSMHGYVLTPDQPRQASALYASTAPATVVDGSRFQDLLMPREKLNAVGQFPKFTSDGFGRLEIEVSHSKHELRLYKYSRYGRKDLLWQTRVGLGASSFPTPKGVYFVTHIYDDEPLWVPPRDRAWAAGQRPSRRVYGGTMAPLLKKRMQRSRRRRKQDPKSEDFIAGQVVLKDYDYRFHGTNQPRSIGRNQSHGCVRMLPEAAERLADYIKHFLGTNIRGEGENGTFVLLKAPVRLNIVR
jgi:hypothetical protein